MSLDTDAGKASVSQACRLFQVSRQAYYQAKAGSGPRPSRLRLVEAREFSQREVGPPTASPDPDPVEAAPHPVAPPSDVTRYTPTGILKEAIQRIADAHPAWGVRKVWATLRRRPYELRVGRRRAYALMKAMGLTLPPDRKPRNRLTYGHVVVEEPNRRWATDLTTTWTAQHGLVAILIVIDCGCRSVLQAVVSKCQESPAVLAPVRHALAAEFGSAAAVPDGLELRTDHGPQYTGADCDDLCRDWALDHTFAPVGRPTGNAVAERVIRTLKEECIWLADWNTIEHLQAAIDAWLWEYNNERPHQALDWQTPAERRQERLVGSVRVAA